MIIDIYDKYIYAMMRIAMINQEEFIHHAISSFHLPNCIINNNVISNSSCILIIIIISAVSNQKTIFMHGALMKSEYE